MSNFEMAVVVYTAISVLAGITYAIGEDKYGLNFLVNFFIGFALWPVDLLVCAIGRLK